jgi:integrase
MATSAKRKMRDGIRRKANGKWLVEVRIGRDPVTGKLRRIAYEAATYEAARAWRDEQRVKRSRGRVIAPARTTFGEYLIDWLEGSLQRRGEHTRVNNRTTITKHVLPSSIAGIKLRDIQVAHIANLYRSLPEEGTVRLRVHRVVHAALNDALENELIDRNPASKRSVRQTYRKSGKVKAWSADESRALLTAAPREVGNAKARFTAVSEAVDLCLRTGLRLGELLGLEWPDFDADAATLTVRRSLTVVSGRRLLQEFTKTDSSLRTITLDPESVALLRAWRTRQKAERLAAGPDWYRLNELASPPAPNSFVFTLTDGRMVHPQTFEGWFRRIVANAEIAALTPHALRHTHATLLLVAGHDLLYVSRRLGHSTVAITGDLYGHTVPAMERRLALGFSQILRGGDQMATTEAIVEGFDA